jgi:hypothetical protein
VGTTASATFSTATTAGNCLVAYFFFAGGSSVTASAPANWVLLRRANNGTAIGGAAYVYANAPSTTAVGTFTAQGGIKCALIVIEYQGTGGGIGPVIQSISATATATACGSGSLTVSAAPAGSTVFEIGFGWATATTTTSSSYSGVPANPGAISGAFISTSGTTAQAGHLTNQSTLTTYNGTDTFAASASNVGFALQIVVTYTTTKQHNTDSGLKGTSTQSHSTDSDLKKTSTVSHSTSSILVGPLVGYYQLNETALGAVAIDSSPVSTNAADSQGRTTAATLAPTTPPLLPSSTASRHFPNNTTPYTYLYTSVAIPAHGFNNNYTIAAWVRLQNVQGNQPFVSHQVAPIANGWGLMTNSQGFLNSTAPSGSLVSTQDLTATEVWAAIQVGVWTHVSTVVTATNRYLYVNGQRSSVTSTALGNISPNLPTQIGTDYSSNPANYFQGDIDDVRIYRVALTNDQMSSLANGLDPFATTTSTRSHSTDALVAKAVTTVTKTHNTDSYLLKASTAVFLQRDTWRLGNWVNAYGGQGYSIMRLGGQPDVAPTVATVALSGGNTNSSYNPPTTSPLPPYLQIPVMPGYAGLGVYSGFGANNFTINITDGLVHAISFYVATVPTQPIQAYDVNAPASPIPIGPVQNTNTNANIGVYMVWNISGNVQFNIGMGTGGQSFYSGWFLDAARSVNSVTHTTDTLRYATFTKSHTTDTSRRATFTKTHNTDSSLRKTFTVTHNTDAWLRATFTRTHTTDTSKRATFTKAHNTDAWLKATFIRTHTTSTTLKATYTRTHTADSALKGTVTRVHSTDTFNSSGLLSYWKLDETATGAVAIDSMPLGANATDNLGTTTPSSTAPISAPTWPYLNNPRGRNFSGASGNFLTTANPLPAHGLTSNFSITAWVRFSSSSKGRPIISHQISTNNRGWGLLTDGSNLLNFYACSGSASNPLVGNDLGALPANTWVHLAGVVTATTRYVYVNGKRSIYSSPFLPAASTDLPTRINSLYTDATAAGMIGDMDEIRFYNVPLSFDQISTLANGGDPGLVNVVTQTHSTDTLTSTFITLTKTHSTDTGLIATFTKAHSTDVLKNATFIKTHSTDTLRNATLTRTHNTDSYLFFPASATYLQRDASCNGKGWPYAYGSQGYSILSLSGTPDVLPLHCTVTLAGGGLVNPWSGHGPVNTPADPRYLLIPPSPYVQAGLSLYYGPGNLTVTVNLDDGKIHAVSLYAACFSSPQNVSVYDVTSPGSPVLICPSQNSGDINTTGVYMVWNVSGRVQFQIALTGPDSVLNGWFIDPVRSVNTKAHSTDSDLRATFSKTHGTDANLRATFSKTHNTDSLLRATFVRIHSTDANLRATYIRTHTTDANLLATFTKTHTTDTSKRATFTRTHNTDANLRATYSKTHSADSWLRLTVSKTHGTDSDLLKTSAKTHNTDASLVKTFTKTHNTDSDLRETFTRTHSTDSYLFQTASATFVQQDTWRNGSWVGPYGTQGYSLLGLGGQADVLPPKCSVTLANGSLNSSWIPPTTTPNPLYLPIPSMPGYAGLAGYWQNNPVSITFDLDDGRSHSIAVYAAMPNAGNNLQATFTVYNVTDPNNPILIDPGEYSPLPQYTSVYMVWNASGRIKVVMTGVPTNTNFVIFSAWFIDPPKSVGGKTHNTDTLQRATFTRAHGTDSWLRETYTRTHSTDANLLATFTKTHTTDTSKRATFTRIHNTDSWLRATFTRNHSTDGLLRKTYTKAHTTDTLLPLIVAKTHTTSSDLKGTQTRAHTADSYVLSVNTVIITHTTSSDLKGPVTRVHSTDSNLLKTFTRTHNTDSNLLKTFTKVHNTDSDLKGAITRAHGTDSLLRKTFTVGHGTDSDLVKSVTKTHNTDSNLRATFTRVHSTSSDLKGAVTRVHSTDSNLVKSITRTHNTDSDLVKSVTKAHATDSDLKGAMTRAHGTDSDLKGAMTRAHSTDSNLVKSVTKAHSTDSNLLKTFIRIHTTDSSLRQTITQTHTTDTSFPSLVTRIQVHSTDTFLLGRLVSYWKLDETGSFGPVAIDSQPLGANATDHTGSTYASTLVPLTAPTHFANTASRFFPPMSIPGPPGDYLDAGPQPAHDFISNFTVTAWVRLHIRQSNQPIITRQPAPLNGGWGLMTNNQGFLVSTAPTTMDTQTLTPTESWMTVPTGYWTFVGMVTTATTRSLYVGMGGSKVTSNLLGISNPSAPTQLGVDYSGNPGYYFQGDLDDVRIYASALTVDEMQSLAGGFDPFAVITTTKTHTTDSLLVWSTRIHRTDILLQSPLVSYWNLDEVGSGQLAIDWGWAAANAADVNGGTTNSATVAPLHFYNPHARNFPLGGTPVMTGAEPRGLSGNTYLATSTPAAPHGFATNFTVTMWIQTMGSNANQPLIGHQVSSYDRGWGMATNNSGVLTSTACNSGSNQLFTPTQPWMVVPGGVWTFVAMVTTASTRTIYVNTGGATMSGGLAKASPDLPTFLGASYSSGTLRGPAPVGSQYYYGNMDDARIYNVALTNDQIQTLAGGFNLPMLTTTKKHTTDMVTFGLVGGIMTRIQEHFTDVMVRKTSTKTHGTDSLLFKPGLPITYTRTHNTDASLRKTQTRTHITDSYLRSASTAVFLQRDSWRLGNWVGAYGGQGYSIMQLGGQPDVLPSSLIATVTLSGGNVTSTYVPPQTNPLPMYLQIPIMPGYGGLGMYVGFGATDITIVINDNLVHAVSIYVADVPTELITVYDITNPGNPILIDPGQNTNTNANVGAYMVWNVSGHVQFNIGMGTGGAAYYSAWFLDPARSIGTRTHTTDTLLPPWTRTRTHTTDSSFLSKVVMTRSRSQRVGTRTLGYGD